MAGLQSRRDALLYLTPNTYFCVNQRKIGLKGSLEMLLLIQDPSDIIIDYYHSKCLDGLSVKCRNLITRIRDWAHMVVKLLLFALLGRESKVAGMV